MSTNYALEWAKRVVAAKPVRPSAVPVADRAEVFTDLSTAYAVLADQAVADRDADAAIGYRELAEHYEWLGEQWYREGVTDDQL